MLRKDEVFAYVELVPNLKDLKDVSQYCAFISVLQKQRVERERTPGPGCLPPNAGGLSAWSFWSGNRMSLTVKDGAE